MFNKRKKKMIQLTLWLNPRDKFITKLESFFKDDPEREFELRWSLDGKKVAVFVDLVADMQIKKKE